MELVTGEEGEGVLMSFSLYLFYCLSIYLSLSLFSLFMTAQCREILLRADVVGCLADVCVCVCVRERDLFCACSLFSHMRACILVRCLQSV